MRFKPFAATGLLALIPALSGCLTRTHSVLKTRPPDVVYTATLDNLLQQVADRYKATQTATLFVEMSASSGGHHEGKVTEPSFSFSGYIILQNPDHIRIVIKLPIVRSDAMDMVSDGKTFKMRIPPNSCAIIGSDTAPPPPSPGANETLSERLYRLRPAVILDALLIPALEPGQDVSMTQDTRPPYEAPKTKTEILTGKGLHRDYIEEPDYDIEFLSQPKGQVANTLRVLHIGRSNLLPYQQDLYNADGTLETQVTYDNYQHFGDIVFPTRIVIQRKLDELGLTITVDTKKTSFNQQLDADTFVADPIPSTYAIQNMDDPISAKSNPCVNHPTPATPAPSTTK